MKGVTVGWHYFRRTAPFQTHRWTAHFPLPSICPAGWMAPFKVAPFKVAPFKVDGTISGTAPFQPICRVDGTIPAIPAIPSIPSIPG
jgi:hypothetical protein